jgi:hypothetical protein
MEMEEGQSLKRLHTDDIYAPGDQKKRAASPNDEYMLSMPLNTSRGRELSPRRSPQGRFISPRVATMPSVHTSRSNSCISTMSMSMHPGGHLTHFLQFAWHSSLITQTKPPNLHLRQGINSSWDHLKC